MSGTAHPGGRSDPKATAAADVLDSGLARPAVAQATESGRLQTAATRVAFLVNGLVMAGWAPLVPYVRTRLQLDEGGLGLLLLALGGGSLLAMPVTGMWVARSGCRRPILASTLALAILLPALAWLPWLPALALALFLFGAAIGCFDVAMNIQAVRIEALAGRALMSGFHGFFSIGGFIGAGLASALLWLGFTPLVSAVVIAGMGLCAMLAVRNGLLEGNGAPASRTPLLVMPHGMVAVLGVLCFVLFLAEGAILDWSAVLLVERGTLAPSLAGLGYAVFAAAMTVGRFSGDALVARFGARVLLVVGALLAATGFGLATQQPLPASFAGFVLIGLGCANIVPVLFSAAGRQQRMPAALAVAAVATLGYAGILIGPALIGAVAHAGSLMLAFAGLAVALLLVAPVGAWALRK